MTVREIASKRILILIDKIYLGFHPLENWFTFCTLNRYFTYIFRPYGSNYLPDAFDNELSDAFDNELWEHLILVNDNRFHLIFLGWRTQSLTFVFTVVYGGMETLYLGN